MGRQFGKSFTFYLDLPFEALRLIFGLENLSIYTLKKNLHNSNIEL